MTIADLTRIDKAIEIQAPPERVWRALTDARELSVWFQMTVEGKIELGAEVWMTTTHPDYAGLRFSVQIVELTPFCRFSWKWHPGAADLQMDYSAEPRTTVTFALEPVAGGTRLSVSETGFNEISLERRAKVYQDNDGGWAEVIVWIQKYAEAN